MPGLEVKPLLDELRKRVAEELDYTLEAASQEVFANAYADDPDFCIPHVVAATEHVLVSDWMNGRPLAKIIAEGSSEDRNRAGVLLVRFLFSGPAGRACCTRTRTRGTSGCWTTVGSGFSTSAPWTGSRTASRRSSASCCASCTRTATSRPWSASCG